MMPCTRLYVDPTEFLMVQARENILLSLLKKQRENMRGHSSLFLIITPKDNTQAFKKAENKHLKRQETGYEGHFSSLYVIIELSPTPHWTCPIHLTPPRYPTYYSYLLCSIPLSPLIGIGSTMMKISIIAPLLHICKQGGQ